MRNSARRYKSNGVFANIKYEISNYFRNNFISIIVVAVIFIIALLTGVLTAVKNTDNFSMVNFSDYSLVQFLDGNLGSIELFFSRMFSFALSIVLILLFSLTIFTLPLAFGVLIFRAYLLGLNCTLLIILFGMNGILTTLLVIFPLQLLAMILIALYCIITTKKRLYVRKYGCGYVEKNKGLKVVILMLLLFLVINIVETILLSVFCSKIILVI